MNSAKRVLPADVYDALELSAWVHGGIGAGSWSDLAGDPVCVHGHRAFVAPAIADNEVIRVALMSVGLGFELGDPAVWDINKRSGNARNARVPFNKWCKELNVVRGA